MAVYDYATIFTQLLQQKYAKELCSDTLTQSNQQVKFINAQTIKSSPQDDSKRVQRPYQDAGFQRGTLGNDWGGEETGA